MSAPSHAHSHSQAPQRRPAGAAEPPGLCRPPLPASRLAHEHEWLIGRVTDRLAACWPEQVEPARLHREAWIALQRTAACVDRVEDLPAAAAAAIETRMRKLLAGSPWYRQTLARRVRPLCEAWRGALIAGRRPSDQMLCARLHIGTAEIAGVFAEAALVFLVDPAVLLPIGTDALGDVGGVLVDLPTDQQLAVTLYSQQHLTIGEIARVMTIEPVAAQELLGRAAMGIVAHAGLTQWPGGRVVSA